MESIIAQQKISRRRSSGIKSPALPASRSGSPGKGHLPAAPLADFFLLEGGTNRSYLRQPRGRSNSSPARPRVQAAVSAEAPRQSRPFSLSPGPRFRTHRFRRFLAALLASVRRLPAFCLSRFTGLFHGPGSSSKGRGRFVAEWRSRNIAWPPAESAAPQETKPETNPEPAEARSSLRRALPRLLSFLAAGSLLLALAFIGLSLIRDPSFPLPAAGLIPGDSTAEEALLAFLTPELAEQESEETSPPPLPRSLEIDRYTVKTGDSLGAIARRFGLSMDSLISMNGIKSARGLRAGTELKIPNMDGLLHIVGKGESLGSIAGRYKIEVSALADANDLGTAVIQPGQTLFIPGASLAKTELKRVLGELIIWPIRGPLSSYYGYRPDPFTGVRRFHAGIDIVASPGTPIKASSDGRIADVGYNAIYGNYVILNHADGMQSLYGHLTAYSVRRGQPIEQGQTIGTVGNTGYSTGPHLHFGLFKGGASVNPLKYLK